MHDVLPPHVRSNSERAFAQQFADVAVHADARQSAVASTHDGAIIFAPGHETNSWLVAHELAHVVQQRGGTGGLPLTENALEIQADRAATAVERGWQPPPLSAAGTTTKQDRVELRDVGRGEQSGFARVPELIDRLNVLSPSLLFENDGGLLTYTQVEGTTPSEFDRQMMSYIDDPQTLPLRFTNRHGLLGDRVIGFHTGVLVDAFSSGYVDIDDLLASSEIGLQIALTHFLRERQSTRNYDRRIGTPSLDPGGAGRVEFDRGHDRGLDAEQAVLRDFFGDPTIRFIDRNQRIYRNSRRDTIRIRIDRGHGAAGHGIEAVNFEVVLHDTHRVISAEEYRDLLESERTAEQVRRERLQGATEHREGAGNVPAP